MSSIRSCSNEAIFHWRIAFFLALGASACDEEGARAERQELAGLTRAIDALRDADNGRKAEPLAQLEEHGCLTSCELKAICVGAYRAQVAATQLVGEFRKSSGPRGRSASDAELSAARVAFEAAHQKAEVCTEAEFAAKKRLGLD